MEAQIVHRLGMYLHLARLESIYLVPNLRLQHWSEVSEGRARVRFPRIFFGIQRRQHLDDFVKVQAWFLGIWLSGTRCFEDGFGDWRLVRGDWRGEEDSAELDGCRLGLRGCGLRLLDIVDV